MFKAVMSDIDLLRDSIAAIAEIIDEAVFDIDNSGMRMRAADRAMVAAVDFRISKDAFDSFEITEPIKLGLNLENFLSVLKRASAGDKILLSSKDSKFEIIIQNSSKRRFVLPLLEIAQEEAPQIEQLEFSVKMGLNAGILENGIEDAGVVSDALLFEASSDRFKMRAEGDVTMTETELEKGSEGLLDLSVKEEARARYPLDYLKKMIKAKKLSDKVRIEFGKDFPMKLTFEAGDKCALSFVLAPRVIEE